MITILKSSQGMFSRYCYQFNFLTIL